MPSFERPRRIVSPRDRGEQAAIKAFSSSEAFMMEAIFSRSFPRQRDSNILTQETEAFLVSLSCKSIISIVSSISSKHLQIKTTHATLYYLSSLGFWIAFSAAEDAWMTDSITSAGSKLKPQARLETPLPSFARKP